MAGGVPTELTTLLIYWVTIWFSNFLAQKSRLSPLLFYLIFGCIYGNTGVAEQKNHTMTFMAEMAITMVFLSLGFEENVSHFIGGIKKSWGIALIGAIVPFICGFSVTYAFYPEAGMNAIMMAGLAVTATAVSLTMISLKSEGLAVSNAAIGIMTSAVLDDVMCLALVAVMVPIATGKADPTIEGISWILAKSLMFVLVIATLNTIVFPIIRKSSDYQKPKFCILRRIPLIRSFGVHTLTRFNHGEQALLLVLIIGLGVGLGGTLLGFHPTIGAYMAGLVLEERYFDIEPEAKPDQVVKLDRQQTDESMESDKLPEGWTNSYDHVKDLLENAAFSWLGPIFFLNLGCNIKVQPEVLPKVIGPAFAFYLALLIGQILSAALSARFVPGGFTWAESWMIGFGMLGRAELFFVVLDTCHIQNHVLDDELFFALTFAAMMLNVTVPIAISLYKPYYLKAQEADIAAGNAASNVSAEQMERLKAKVLKEELAKARRIYKSSSPDFTDEELAGIGSKQCSRESSKRSNSSLRGKPNPGTLADNALQETASSEQTGAPLQAWILS
eukprot:TRINITY_DN11105_c0_g1_i1.p1 TRINITY_DN11105_c0_g1~~TRINITY_DN11105_c0_g1_i1.p1  ORF type:complete len:558 (+),score=94.88 TRINITY_DN11105_c0_g1_i1:59-1732(+)